MKVKSTILSALLVAGFAISSVTSASTNGGGDGNGGGASSRDGGADHGGADHDNAHGEQNHDNDLQSAENSSRRHHRRHATPVSEVGIGEPTNPNNSYNESKDMMRDHR